MSYKFSTGSIRKGDIYFEDDRDGEPTYIDFGLDTITLRPSGSQILFAKSDAVGVNTITPAEILTINGVESQSDQTMIKFTEDGSDRALIGINTSNNILIENLYSNKHIVFKASDAGTAREGLRLDGAVPEVVVNQTSDSLVDFRVESDNNTHMLFVDGGNDKVGIGTDAPDYTLDVAGDIGVNQYIYHNGDSNTWINFTDNRIRLNAGGNNFIDCEDPGSAPHKVRINNGGNNIDFVIKDNSNNVYFTADASTARIGIGTDTPIAELDVAGKIAITTESSTPAQPADGQGYIYTKSDGKLYWRSHDQSETDLTATGGASSIVTNMTHHRYNDGSGTGLEYIPWAGTSEQNSPSWITQGVAPYAGKLLKVLVRSSKANPSMGSTTVGIHTNVDGNTVVNQTPEETETVNIANANTTYTFTFSNANHFGPGDVIGVSIDPTNAHGNVNVTCVWEYDTSA